jgi:hypothetical protein
MARLTDDQGETLTLYHGTHQGVDTLDAAKTVDGGLHVGTRAQAQMRNAQRLFHVHLDLGRVRRSQDRGGDWADRIKDARTRGFDAIVYLNRYEGIPLSQVQRAADEGVDLDRLSDQQFRRRIPEAHDSWIVLNPHAVTVVGVEDRPARTKRRAP